MVDNNTIKNHYSDNLIESDFVKNDPYGIYSESY